MLLSFCKIEERASIITRGFSLMAACITRGERASPPKPHHEAIAKRLGARANTRVTDTLRVALFAGGCLKNKVCAARFICAAFVLLYQV